MIKLKDGFSGERAIVLPRLKVEEMENDIIASKLYITDIGFYPHALHHYRRRLQPITQYVFIYCTDGAGRYTLKGKTYEVGANQYFILPAGVPHTYASDEQNPWTIYWIHFKGELAPYFSLMQDGPVDVRPGVFSRISNRIDLFEEIMHTLEMSYMHENLLYACSIFHHFLGTLRYLQQYREAGYATGGQSEIDVVGEAIHYMKENIGRRLTLRDIARHSGYSPSRFSEMFSKSTGSSPLAYFNRLKVQKACNLLDFTDMKINRICYKVGIDDCYYFSRLFRKVMGMSPRDYRAMEKG